MRFIEFKAAIKFTAPTPNTSIGYNNQSLQLSAPLMEKKSARAVGPTKNIVFDIPTLFASLIASPNAS
jgi:hypothetical protein